MRFQHELGYDASLEDVHSMLADPAFREKVCEAQQGRSCSVSIDPHGTAMSVEVDQRRPSADLPGFARKVVGDEIRIIQKEQWKDSTGAALEVTIPGKPGRLDGTIELTDNESGSAKVVDGDLTVDVPLLSGKLESLISDLLHSALEAEQRIGRGWLAGER